MRHDLISGDQRRTAMRPSIRSHAGDVDSRAGNIMRCHRQEDRRLDALEWRLSRTVPRWLPFVIGHYRRYARSKCKFETWNGLSLSCPRCSSLGIMSLALPARNHVCRSIAQRQLLSDIRVAASCITPKVAVSPITSTPGFSSCARFNAVSGPRLRSRSRLPQTCHSHQS